MFNLRKKSDEEEKAKQVKNSGKKGTSSGSKSGSGEGPKKKSSSGKTKSGTKAAGSHSDKTGSEKKASSSAKSGKKIVSSDGNPKSSTGLKKNASGKKAAANAPGKSIHIEETHNSKKKTSVAPEKKFSLGGLFGSKKAEKESEKKTKAQAPSVQAKDTSLEKKRKPKEKISLSTLSRSYLPPESIEVEEFGLVGEKSVMTGLILGDIAGTRYEDGEMHTRPSDSLWKIRGLHYTGNTILADAIQFGAKKLYLDGVTEKKTMRLLFSNVLKRAYAGEPDAGYERDFERWAAGQMRSDELRLYQSKEDSSAVRAAVIGAMFDDSRTVIDMAMMSAVPTHAHPEGIRGAVVAAMCVYLACHEAGKRDILRYARQFYNGEDGGIAADVSLSSLELGGAGRNSANCEYVVPAAVSCFVNSSNFEDAIRNALSIDGDCSAIAAVAGAIAAGFYGATVADASTILHHYSASI